MNLSPERVIVSGDKSTLIMRPVFGEYYNAIIALAEMRAVFIKAHLLDYERVSSGGE